MSPRGRSNTTLNFLILGYLPLAPGTLMSSLAATVVAISQSQTQNTMQMLMLKSAHRQDQAVVDMLSQAVEQGQAQAAAPAGTGALVDISV